MSKILFTIAIPHDGPRRPQFIISTNNLYSIQLKGTDFKGVKFGNSNLGNGIRHRFEYSVGGSKGVTRLSLVVNTTAVLPHMTWAFPHLSAPPKSKEQRGHRGEDDRRVSRHSQGGRSRHRSTNHRRRHHAIDDGNVEAGHDVGGDDGGHDGGGDDGGGY